jgi:lipopolysaccharide transport protein LptA
VASFLTASVGLSLVAGLLLAGCAGKPVSELTSAVVPLNRPAASRDRSRSQPVTVDADAIRRIDGTRLVIATGNVIARHSHSIQYADRMKIYVSETGDRIERVALTGNVRVVTGDGWTATALSAEYDDRGRRVVLNCDASARRGKSVISGNSLAIYLGERASIVTEEWREPECPVRCSPSTASR